MTKTKVAIIGSGNIGTDLMIKVLRMSRNLELSAMVGVDPLSDGLARAKRLGVWTTAEGLEGLRQSSVYDDIAVIFDATSASAHHKHAAIIAADGKVAIDLTPAAIGPYVIPAVNMDTNLSGTNLNMVTCGGQATIPIVAAISQISPVIYAEIVASISSLSAGPGTRANIDEFTQTTANAIEKIGGAQRGKAIIILNPADPPVVMRDTVYCLVEGDDRDAIAKAVTSMVEKVQAYVPGYRLKQEVQFETINAEDPLLIGGLGQQVGTKVTVFLEVIGAGHYLPEYAGNLDIMTSAAMATADMISAKEPAGAAL